MGVMGGCSDDGATFSLHESSPSLFHFSYSSNAFRNRAVSSRNNNINSIFSNEDDERIKKK